MKSSSSSSCFGTFLLVIVSLVLIRFALPGMWKLLVGITTGFFYFGLLLFLILLIGVGFFTYKNMKSNKLKEEERKYEHITRTETLYKSVVDRLQRDITLNQVSVEELLQAEVLVSDKLKETRLELIRLKDFASPKNHKILDSQIRDYREQLRQTTDPSVKQVINENLKMLDEKKARMTEAIEEIRQKEASVDLIFNCLVRTDDDLKFGRPVARLFPPEIYGHFDLSTPAPRDQLPPLIQKSSIDE